MYHREFDEYDPDLEARLYGEIHHSNETYSDHVSSRSQCDSHRKTSSYDYQWAIDPMPSYDMNNSGNHRTVGLMPNYDNSQQHRSSMNYPTNNAAYSSRNFRPLMQEIVHPPGISAQYSYPSHSNPSRPPPLRQRYNNNYHNNIYIENQRPSSHRSRSNIRTSNHNIEKRSKSNQPGNTSKINKKPHVSNKNKYGPTTSKKKSNKNNTNSDQNPSKSTNSQLTIETDKNSKVNSYNFEKNDDPSKNDVPSKNDNQLENNGESISKYDVAMKSNEELQINPADEKSVSINLLSDSDESILEVPVPPKPIPLLINLQDSDDEALSNDDNDNEQSPVIMADKTKELLQTPVSPAAEEDLNLSVKIIPSTALASSESVENSVDNVSNETSVTPNNNEEYSNDNDTIANNIIINCTQVATGVTTLSDIKRLRDGVHSTSNNNILSDDDSMTESEAMKWGQIEGQMAGNKGDNSTDQIWNQFGQNTEDSVIKTTDNPVVHDSITNSIELGGNVDKTTDNGNNSRIKSNSNGSKKRMHELDSSIHEGTNDMSDHRNKRRKSTRQMSFEEYVFQPMPKKLEAFYNEPRGIMMDVHKIQNRMPNNPNRWAILDEDRGGYFQLREKKRMCSTCQREGHTHEKCPKTRPISTCHMCGKIGHQEPRCPYSMCLTCGTKFSSYRKTCENCRKSKCIICKSQGHTNNNCPDLWRRYHQTTTGTSVIVPTNPLKILKPLNQLICCNCTGYGHHSTNCRKYRWSQHFQTPRFVTSYTTGPNYLIDDNGIMNDEDDLSFHTINSDNQNDIPIPEAIELPRKDPEKKLIYSYSTASEMRMETWPTKIIVLPILSEINLNQSDFFESQFPTESSCRFGVEIIQISPKKLQIIFRTPNNQTLEIFEKIVIQWIKLRENKANLTKECSQCLPWKKYDLLSVLLQQIDMIIQNTTPNTLRKANIIVTTVQQLGSKKVSKSQKIELRNKLHQITNEVILATYNYSLVPDAEETLNELVTLIRNIAAYDNINNPVPPAFYMSAVWFKFKLFTSIYIAEEVLSSAVKMSKKYQNVKKDIKQQKELSSITASLFKNIITKETLLRLARECNCNPIDFQPTQIHSPDYNIRNKRNVSTDDNSHSLNVNYPVKSKKTNIINTVKNCEVVMTSNKEDSSAITTDKQQTTTKKDKKKTQTTEIKNFVMKMPFNLKKPKMKYLENHSQILKYANAAVVYAIQNNLNKMISKAEHIVDRAKLNLVQKEEILDLWGKMKVLAFAQSVNTGSKQKTTKKRKRAKLQSK